MGNLTLPIGMFDGEDGFDHHKEETQWSLRSAMEHLRQQYSKIEALLKPCPLCGADVSIEAHFPYYSRTAHEGIVKCGRCYRHSDMIPIGELVRRHNRDFILTRTRNIAPRD